MAMMKLGAAAAVLAAQIEAATGLRTYVNPEQCNVPCVLVAPGKVRVDRLDAETYEVDWSVYLVCADHGPIEVMDDLGDMLATVSAHLPVEEAEQVYVPMPGHSGAEMPGLMFKFTTEITPEEG
jgi:hypothetical protein